MLRTLRFLAIGVFVLGLLAGLYFLPSGQVNSDTGNSPLYAASLNSTTDQLSGKDEGRGVDSKGGGEANFQTCEVTCGPTCNQTTCGVTCVSTCVLTCANTCNQTTCSSTCVATCASTCANTCSQPTCESTCVVSCSYTCTPVSMIGFSGEAVDGAVRLHWSTGSEVQNYNFVILRSNSENGEFEVIAEVPSAGNTANTRDYTFTDNNVQVGNTYYYMLKDVSIYGYETLYENVVSVSLVGDFVVGDFVLAQNYPNPFNPETTIRYAVPTSAQTRLNVYDMSGRLVRTLVNGVVPAGNHQVTWNATDNAGNVLPSGVYIYRLNSGELTASGKMVFVK